MIESEYGKIKLTCDVCNETTLHFDTWDEAADYVLDNWSTIKEKNADGKMRYLDVCDECVINDKYNGGT